MTPQETEPNDAAPAPGRAADRTDRLFVWVWRFNGLLIAVVGVLALGFGLIGAGILAYELFGPRNTQQVAVAPSASGEIERSVAPVALKPEGFHKLGATGLLYAQLRETADVSDATSSLRYRKVSANLVDWLIYDPASGASRMLIGRRANLLISAHMLHWSERPEADPIDRAIFIRHVDEDTNGDGLLTAADRESLALAAPDGLDLTPLSVAGAYRGVTLISRDEAVLLTASDAGATAHHIDLETREITRTTPLPLGSERLTALR